MDRFCDISHEEQLNIRKKVFLLKTNGLGYKRIIKRVAKEDKVKLSLSTLSYWFTHKVKLVGGENYFEAEPSPELAYILGVMFGDGSLTHDKKKQEYNVRLDAIDKDFVEKFSGYVSKLLGKEKDYVVCLDKRGMYATKARSKQLYYFIKSVKENF